MVGKNNCSLRSPWISISRAWRKVEVLATFNIGNGRRIGFWGDPWFEKVALKLQFLKLFRIALSPKGSIEDHWDSITQSWALLFRRMGKVEVLAERLKW
uniref:Uncharacterized protein n=1 Tax=Cucumis melo TaxID=3656 RepID=A0A9I9EHW8_CUCME